MVLCVRLRPVGLSPVHFSMASFFAHVWAVMVVTLYVSSILRRQSPSKFPDPLDLLTTLPLFHNVLEALSAGVFCRYIQWV